MAKKRICIDPGHQASKTSGGDPGAVSGSYYESVAALAIAKKTRKKLAAAGYEVIMTRTGGDKDLTLAERVKKSNQAGCELYISIHLNSATNSSANGTETAG